MSSERGSRKRRGMALGLAALLFATGVAAGVAVDRWMLTDGHAARRRDSRWWERRRPEALVHRYTEELGLSAEQVRPIEEILRRTWSETRRQIESVEPQVDAIRRRGDDEIRPLLRPEQRKRFDEMVAEQEARRAAMRRGLDLPHPPGSRR